MPKLEREAMSVQAPENSLTLNRGIMIRAERCLVNSYLAVTDETDERLNGKELGRK